MADLNQAKGGGDLQRRVGGLGDVWSGTKRMSRERKKRPGRKSKR